MGNPGDFQPLRIAILKADRFYADSLLHSAHGALPEAEIVIFNRIADAKALLGQRRLDLLVTGVNMVDGDILDFLAADRPVEIRPRRTLVVTGRREPRLFASLFQLRISGVFDSASEGCDSFQRALCSVLEGNSYWSPALVEYARLLNIGKNCLFARLTPMERLVLAEIGDGSDDDRVADRLGVQPSTILGVRRELHRKLGVQHRGELFRIAVQDGFVRLTPGGIVRPGYEGLLAARRAHRVSATSPTEK